MVFVDEIKRQIISDLSCRIDPEINLIPGEVQRFDTEKTGDKAGWLVVNSWVYKSDLYYSGVYGSFKKGNIAHTYSSNKKKDKHLIKAEYEAIVKIKDKVKEEHAEKNLQCKLKYEPIYTNMPSSLEVHQYLKNKKINSNYRGKIDENGVLYIPIYKSTGFTGVQRIFFSLEENKFIKKYSYGVDINGAFCPFGTAEDIANSDFVYIAEGYATAATVYELTGIPVICCFMANNITKAVGEFRKLFPHKKMVIAADNDDSKTGLKEAKRACKDHRDIIYKMPEFEHKTASISDFNDLLCLTNAENTFKQLKVHNVDNFDLERFQIDKENKFQFLDENGKTKKDYEALVNFFHATYKHVRMTDIKKTMVYDGRIYRYMDDEEIGLFAKKYFANTTVRDIDEFVKRTRYHTQSTHQEFSSQVDGYINFANGVYDIAERELLPHSHEYRFQYFIPVNYEKGATCPVWDMLLNNVTCERQDLINIINEFMGFSISNDIYDKPNAALILDGSGSNGKSTFLNCVHEVLNQRNISNVSMGKLNTDKFMAYDMVNKLINVSEEEDQKVFAETGIFKKLTGNSPMYIQKKGEQGFSFRSRSKIIISYNNVPYLGDLSTGMLRRLYIIPFDMNFDHNPSRQITDIISKIRKEKSGIINRWLEGYHRMREQGDLTKSHLVMNKRNAMVINSDSILAFFSENIEVNQERTDWFIPLKVLYERFSEDSGIHRTSIRTVVKKVKKHFDIDTTQRRWAQHGAIVKENCKGFVGLRFKDDSLYSSYNGVNS